MAEGAAAPRVAPSWVVIVACVALELVVASSRADGAVRGTALLGLAGVAVALSLRQALGGLAGSRAVRAAVVAPLVFSIVVAVVLILDAHVRGASLAR